MQYLEISRCCVGFLHGSMNSLGFLFCDMILRQIMSVLNHRLCYSLMLMLGMKGGDACGKSMNLKIIGIERREIPEVHVMPAASFYPYRKKINKER
ncbi:hypothetical protein SAMN05421687_10914 [Salimicrobium flavidum]|uniref:Uncharacterized protein n=1 Tax=Salimicrobium flavidum TaxID=570947 RepID=A0A1N7K4T0_9BACI|nr:hypothetical protein SAMN05421687_10914 [Salimicrobium flavidum]